MNLCRLTISDLQAKSTGKAIVFPEDEIQEIKERLETIEEKSSTDSFGETHNED